MSEAFRRRPGRNLGGGESYFVSLNDLLVGMLFIFIILLMAFALSYQSAERKLKNELSERTNARTVLLERLDEALRKQNIEIDLSEKDNGVLRLPESTLFPIGSADLDVSGRRTLQVLATTMAELLPCYSDAKVERKNCPEGADRILEAVYVEGHTDNAPIKTARFADNWELSSARAIHTYNFMADAAPTLRNIRNASGTATLFGVSAYADQRPAGSNASPEGRASNRRIDIRFLLSPPGKATLSNASGLKVETGE